MNIEPSLNTWTSIFLVVAVHGMILAAIFYSRKHGRKLPNVLLGSFLLLFSLNLAGNVLYWSRYGLVFPHLVGISGMFQFLYGPILFFYGLSILNPDRKWKKWDIAHLVPLVLFLIWMSPFYLLSVEEKAAYITASLSDTLDNPQLSNTALTVAGIKSVIMLGYGIAVCLLPYYIQKYKSISFRITDDTKRWVRWAGCGFLGFVGFYITYFVLVETIDFQVEYDYMISFAMSGFIFGLGYVNLLKPVIIDEAHNGKFKYESSSLSSYEADKYLQNLLDYMSEKKPYLEGDLKISDLAEQLSVPSHHLSQIINERLGKNFFEFVNGYRVEEAKKMLADPGKKDYKILRVAFESGFNNKTTFNIAFKEEVGTTPSQYRNQHLNGT